jgi:hypothetical protein
LRWTQCAILILGTAFLAQCGKAPSTSIDTNGGFTLASLKGNYTYIISGVLAGGFLYEEAGTFIADGNGNITSGTDDFLQGSLVSQPFAGSYDITSDGAGMLSLAIGNKSVQWAITLATESQLYIVEFDNYGTGGGGARRQTPSALEALPSGSFAFRTHNSQGSVAKVGVFTTQSNGSLTGMEDVLRQDMLISPSISGSISQPDQNGRGTIHFQESTGVASTFNYYVIDSHTLNLLQIDMDSLGEGRAEQRNASTFDSAALHGSFAFKSSGDTPASIGGVNSVGRFNADGNGSITLGTYDTVSDGMPLLNAPTNGSYNVENTGRVSVSLNPQGMPAIQEVGWLVDSSHGFFLIDSTDRVEDGRFDQQSTVEFSNSSLNGQFGFVLSGYDDQTPHPVSRLGVVVFDGGGVARFQDYLVNRSGLTNRKGGFSGTYNVTAEGRISVEVPGVTKALIGHLMSNNVGYLLVADEGAEEPGRLEQAALP